MEISKSAHHVTEVECNNNKKKNHTDTGQKLLLTFTSNIKFAGISSRPVNTLHHDDLMPPPQLFIVHLAMTTFSYLVPHREQAMVGSPSISTHLKEHFFCGQVTMLSCQVEGTGALSCVSLNVSTMLQQQACSACKACLGCYSQQ